MDKRDLPIAAPCTMDWRSMTPRDGGRFCGDCRKVVRDLSKMSEREARELLRRPRNEGLCVRYVHDRHGKIFFAGDRSRDLVPASSLLQRAKHAALAAAAVAVPVALAGCSGSDSTSGASSALLAPHEEDQYHHEMNEVMGGAPALERIADVQGDAGDAGLAPSSDVDAGPADDGGTRSDAAPRQ
jgi:hypothetical protein